MLKGRESSKTLGAAAPADLLVCFPSRSRAHLTLMPKPICSPVRGSSDPNKRHHHHHLKRVNTRAAISSSGGPGSPLIWAKDNQIRGGGPESSEPTSPKVTCAGQIKVRPSSSSGCRNWQSVMEEIERIHNRSKHKKKSSSSWVGTFGFKKDVMNFLTCLRNIRFDFRCFGSIPDQDISSDEDDDEDEDVFDDEDSFKEAIEDDNTSENNAVFSKWFMVLQENNNQGSCNATTNIIKPTLQECKVEGNDDSVPATAIPPPNALLLMRCRSAPAKSWLEERVCELKDNHTEECNDNDEEMLNKNNNEEKTEEVNNKNNNKEEVKEEKKKRRETLAFVMKYDTDFYKLSSDVAQETWVVGGFNHHFSRSRSLRR